MRRLKYEENGFSTQPAVFIDTSFYFSSLQSAIASSERQRQ
ncbi:hypothetical protein [Pleurocapsa sp. PCC 7327]|nr:hypothetical protein [Pleurocapsa sp. PCC 7327]